MRIVILIPSLHAGAELALNKLLRRKDLNVVGLVRSSVTPLSRSYWRYFRFGFRRAGLFYGFLIGLTIYAHVLGLLLAGLLFWRRRRWLSIDELVKKHNLNLYETENINSEKAIQTIRAWKPDVLVSLYFNQILKKPVIQIPRRAAINMHPGLLPKYRGLWPDFWKLLHREKFAGVTIHHLNEQIDAGEAIAQVKFPIRKQDTKFSLGLRGAQKGTELLIKTLYKLKRRIPLKPLRLAGKPAYYSLPKRENFKLFHARGRKLFSLLEFWREFERRF